jgi:hypothetical protein
MVVFKRKTNSNKTKTTLHQSPVSPTTILHMIERAALTLLNYCLSSNKGNWKHSIKNITERERETEGGGTVRFHRFLYRLTLELKLADFWARLPLGEQLRALKTCNNDNNLGLRLY